MSTAVFSKEEVKMLKVTITMMVVVEFEKPEDGKWQNAALAALNEQTAAWASEYRDGVSCVREVIEPHVDAIEYVDE